jgi:hypothetical protein
MSDTTKQSIRTLCALSRGSCRSAAQAERRGYLSAALSHWKDAEASQQKAIDLHECHDGNFVISMRLRGSLRSIQGEIERISAAIGVA